MRCVTYFCPHLQTDSLTLWKLIQFHYKQVAHLNVLIYVKRVKVKALFLDL